MEVYILTDKARKMIPELTANNLVLCALRMKGAATQEEIMALLTCLYRAGDLPTSPGRYWNGLNSNGYITKAA